MGRKKVSTSEDEFSACKEAAKVLSKISTATEAIRRANDRIAPAGLDRITCAYVDEQLERAIQALASARGMVVSFSMRADGASTAVDAVCDFPDVDAHPPEPWENEAMDLHSNEGCGATYTRSVAKVGNPINVWLRCDQCGKRFVKP